MGSSYIVYDFYKQQINPNASEKRLVAVGRISTVILMVFSAALALLLQNALQLFEVLLVFGAGTGLIFILRWFWWRINAWSEITAMFASGIISIVLKLTAVGPLLFAAETGVFPDWAEYPFVVLVTTIIWLGATFMTQPESKEVLQDFYKKIQPGGPGWSKVIKDAKEENVEIVNAKRKMECSCGNYGHVIGLCANLFLYVRHRLLDIWKTTSALILTGVAIVSGLLLARAWNKMKDHIL